ncbi:sigma-70 family RNA polymerase sigma factor [Pseudomonas sp. P66]|jgi:RNA polymerase sigma factor (sigma-70 family)|uniref:Sigma-70 family RNA polymerase sigma factor n=1 Tax=Pseudomonas arcuscaelestis TaxID=2710591 RepID=A0ABS2C0W9_9PSED|nr:sigma-70 family RNA polymerase sigma factor [Pseudomonas arcuscaelestis]MBM3112468.1 sigma-70 family RNA polymerase sigma factor [Pseudomonas arcuscaelestis]MBM5459522.1 sigma-70 family RNA polymerase sigma factor [Pseudomonas arcuscaelestis]
MSNDPDNRSLTLLYQQHRSELLAFLTRRVRCRETARDLLQDAFVRLMHSERGEIGNLRAFLYRIANNLSIDHARRSQVRGVNDDQALDQLLNETSPERSAVAGNTLDHLERLIDCLPSPTREVFLLARVEQLSYKDIAARLGLDPRAVERHLNKALSHCAAAALNTSRKTEQP